MAHRKWPNVLNVVIPPNTSASVRIATKDPKHVLEGGKPVSESEGVRVGEISGWRGELRSRRREVRVRGAPAYSGVAVKFGFIWQFGQRRSAPGTSLARHRLHR